MNIAKHVLPGQVEQLKAIFEKLDKDGNGTLSVMEIKKSLFDIENGEALFDCLRYGDIDGDN